MFDTHDLQQAPAIAIEAPPQLPMPPVAQSQQPLHVLDRLSAVFKHRRVAGAAFVIVVMAMMVQTYSTIPLYLATARVMIEDERSIAVANLNANDPMFWQDSTQYYNTQYSILKSRVLGQRVVRRLHLQDNPAFNGQAPPRRGPLIAVRNARASLGKAIRRLITRPIQTPAVEPAAPDENAAEAGIISQFIGSINIIPEQTTRLVSIQYRSPDPRFAALAANTIAEEYATQNLDLHLDNVLGKLAWLDDELKKQQQKVTDSEAAMMQYREQKDALSLDSSQNTVLPRLNSLNDSVTRARLARLQKGQVYEQVRAVKPDSDEADNLSIIATSPGVVTAKSRLADLNSQRLTLSSRYMDTHPDIQKLDAQIAIAKKDLIAQRQRVIETAKTDYEAAVAEERSFASSLEDQKRVAMDLDRKSTDYSMLQRQADGDRKMYDTLLQEQKSLQVISNSRSNNVQLMDRAEVPAAPFTPNPRKDWFTAIMAGLLVGVGLAFGIEDLDDTVKTPEDITKVLGLPLLGLVPAIRGERVPLLSEQVPHDFGEAFRSLRTSLVFTGKSEGPRVIAVTSSQPLEGKTTTACNLAMVLALGGSRVLLIDADMRRPGLHKIVGIPNSVGLSHLLVGQVRVREAVQRTSEANLFVMTAGRTPPNPSELLASERMKGFLTNLAGGPFDWVIIDTPPVLAVTDAVIVSRLVSNVVFVVGSEMTRRVHAERALQTLLSGRPQSIGAVLNRVDFDRNKYYYARYYGYQYKSYYGQTNTTPAA